MWNDKWFGDWFGGWFDFSEGEEEHVDLFGGLGEEEEELRGSSASGGRFLIPSLEEDYHEEEILMICNAFLVCHS